MPAQWYASNKRLFIEERDSLAGTYPLLKMEIVPPGTPINKIHTLKAETAIVSGIHRLLIPDSQSYIDYRIAVILPNNYPRRVPRMYCNDRKLPIGNIDRHIMSDGSACLGVSAEIGQKWRSDPRIIFFLNEFVAPFLVWQAYYDAHGQTPPWGQRSHYVQGVFEFYSEILEMPNGPHIIGFMKLLARKNHPQGHEACPCGTGLRLRKCHAGLIQHVRQKVSWKDVCDDLSFIEQPASK